MKLEESYVFTETVGGVKYCVIVYEVDGFYAFKAARIGFYDLKPLHGFYVLDKSLTKTLDDINTAAKNFLDATLTARKTV